MSVGAAYCEPLTTKEVDDDDGDDGVRCSCMEDLRSDSLEDGREGAQGSKLGRCGAVIRKATQALATLKLYLEGKVT